MINKYYLCNMILVVDDDIGIRTSLSMLLRHAHYDVVAVATPEEAIAFVRREEPQLVLLDMNFSLSTSGDEGIILLKQMKLFRPDVPVILITAWGSIQLAVEGMRAGAFDFITKPWNNMALVERIETAIEAVHLKEAEQERLRACPVAKHAEEAEEAGIVGRSPVLLKVMETVKRVAATNAPVLITGESGTGKELVAELIHRNSRRAGERFVKVNLGGISQSLFESEMFGYRKGAFTGANGDRMGRFEYADKGTIFLDEIGDLDPSSQVKLLRVLQDQTFEPLGDSRTRQVNVRLVCATNADLPKLIQEGKFREDLYYRINLITVHLPALRERKEDIPLLAEHFIRKQCEADCLPLASLSEEAVRYLQSLSFPGNIRQLKNMVERAVLMSGKEVITAEDFSDESQLMMAGTGGTLNLEEQERSAIARAMKQYNGNISRVAEALGLSRAALYRRLEKYK